MFTELIEYKGMTPSRATKMIHNAITLGEKEFESLLYYGADVNVRNSLGNPLFHAVLLTASLNFIDILFKYNVDINCQNDQGNTPLHIVSYCCNSTLIDRLVYNGASLNIPNKFKMTPVSIFERDCERYFPDGIDQIDLPYSVFQRLHFFVNHGYNPLIDTEAKKHKIHKYTVEYFLKRQMAITRCLRSTVLLKDLRKLFYGQ